MGVYCLIGSCVVVRDEESTVSSGHGSIIE